MKEKKSGGIPNPMIPYFIEGSYSFIKPEIIAESDRSFPLMLNIEPTLACNLGCFMCPAHNNSVSNMRKSGLMTWELYTKIIDECAAEGGVKILNLHKDGESLLHPKFADMITYAKEKKAAEVIHFNTNLTFKNQKLVDKILLSGVDDITFSIDAACPETFYEVKGKDLYQQVVDNARAFYKRRDELGLKAPYMRVKMLGTGENAEELERFREMWIDTADEVQVQMLHNFAGGLEFDRSLQENRFPCAFLFYSTAINWDGTVTICHRDFKGEDLFGDVNEHTLKEIYTGQKYRRYMELHNTGKEEQISLCQFCDNWKDGPNLADMTQRLANPPGGPGLPEEPELEVEESGSLAGRSSTLPIVS